MNIPIILTHKFLDKLNKDTLIILADFPSDRLMLRFKKLGFYNFIKFSHLEAFQIFDNGRSVTMIIEQPSLTEHSSLYVRAKRF